MKQAIKIMPENALDRRNIENFMDDLGEQAIDKLCDNSLMVQHPRLSGEIFRLMDQIEHKLGIVLGEKFHVE